MARRSELAPLRAQLPDAPAALADCLLKLLLPDATARLGSASLGELREHEWFAGLDWAELRARRLPPPWAPPTEKLLPLAPASEHHSASAQRGQTDSSAGRFGSSVQPPSVHAAASVARRNSSQRSEAASEVAAPRGHSLPPIQRYQPTSEGTPRRDSSPERGKRPPSAACVW